MVVISSGTEIGLVGRGYPDPGGRLVGSISSSCVFLTQFTRILPGPRDCIQQQARAVLNLRRQDGSGTVS
ncbi:unnamed protein product [Allacma fusca]|uniref:Uncharacterized protein n=1 Tax=Allacma fusca TaxID=39272 RepID=A0A8J2LJY9_9HEXA|nr:unnamed protein product [Allacma fusca]